MLPSMQVDVVDYDEVKTGERREGSFASIYSWVLKLSFMAGFLVSGPLLEMTGFKIHLEADQPDFVFTNMRLGFFAIPLVSLVVAFILLKFFPITAKKAAEIRETLEDRRGKV
jgi:GPH family glycoside/pentoside/hexuronide:cation symporter